MFKQGLVGMMDQLQNLADNTAGAGSRNSGRSVVALSRDMRTEATEVLKAMIRTRSVSWMGCSKPTR
jgi:hypothetical protein